MLQDDSPLATVEDYWTIQPRRTEMIMKWLHEPFLKNALEGFYVRFAIGMELWVWSVWVVVWCSYLCVYCVGIFFKIVLLLSGWVGLKFLFHTTNHDSCAHNWSSHYPFNLSFFWLQQGMWTTRQSVVCAKSSVSIWTGKCTSLLRLVSKGSFFELNDALFFYYFFVC